MNKRFLIVTILLIPLLFILAEDKIFRFSLEDYLVDDEPYPECFKEGKNGKIYISDKKSSTIKMFSPEGKFITAIGGKGEGPGQFKYWMGAFAISINGDISQVDFANGNGRITRFSHEGKLLESFPIKVKNRNGGSAIYCRPNGDYIVALVGNTITEKHNSLIYIGGSSSFRLISADGTPREIFHEANVFYDFSTDSHGPWPHIPYMNYIVSAYSQTMDILAFQQIAENRVTLFNLKTKKKTIISNGFKSKTISDEDIDLWLEEEKADNPLFKTFLPYYNKFRKYGRDFFPNKPIVDRLFFNYRGDLYITFYDKKIKQYLVNKLNVKTWALTSLKVDRIPAFIGKDNVFFLIYNEEEESYTVEVKQHDGFF